jgi:hypothetical protein
MAVYILPERRNDQRVTAAALAALVRAGNEHGAELLLAQLDPPTLARLEAESRQRWQTPAGVLDALVDGSWAGPWDLDLWADDDGSNAVTARAEHWRPAGVDPAWRGPSSPRQVDTGRALANPPFGLWRVAVDEAFTLVGSGHAVEVTLVGMADPSTRVARDLARAGNENRPGHVHATPVPLAGRWSFEPPPELPLLLRALGKRAISGSPARAAGVWVLRQVPDVLRNVRGQSADGPGTV